MTTQKRKVSLGFDHYEISEGKHICLLFRDKEEQQRVMSRFLTSGMEAEEKLLYLVDTMPPSEFVAVMKDYGVDLNAYGKKMDLEQAHPVYCPDGHFECDEMITTLKHFCEQTESEGHVGMRGTGEMTWALTEGRVEKQELFRYESSINILLRRHPFTVCCQYDASRFDGETIMDVLAVHPMMIVNEQLIRNPLYVEPEIYLAAKTGN